MATAADINADLTLEIDGPNIGLPEFAKGVRAFFAVLDSICAEVAGGKTAITWRVQVKEGSNLIGVLPAPGTNPAVVAAIATRTQSAMAALEADGDLSRIGEKTIKGLRELATLTGTKPEKEARIRVWVRRQPVELTQKTVAVAAAALKTSYRDYGSVEGRLQMASERGTFHVVVYEPVWDTAIRCNVPDEQSDLALTLFGKRVEVYGLINYRRDGTPTSVDVDEIVPFPPPEDIPSYRDVRGILRQ